MSKRIAVVLGVVAALFVWVTPSWAQQEVAAPWDASSVEPSQRSQPVSQDAVRLNSGGLYRGTIAEMVPGQHVVILLVTGDSRRFEMADVAYAGPANRDPAGQASEEANSRQAPAQRADSEGSPSAQSQPVATVHAEPVRLQFVANVPEVTFHLFTGSATAMAAGARIEARGYNALCTAPCEASLPHGTHTLALSMPRHATREPRSPVTITGPSVVQGTFLSRRKWRIGGMVGGLIGFGGGGAFIAAGIATDDDAPGLSDSSDKLFGAGLGVAVGSLFTGVLIALVARDKVLIEVEPTTSSAP